MPSQCSITMHLVPKCSPDPSYHRGSGITIVSTLASACSSSHSGSRSLLNTPFPPGGSERRISRSAAPSSHCTSATVVTLLYPPLIGRHDTTVGSRPGSTDDSRLRRPRAIGVSS